jgi:hypothetical protein
MRKLIVSVIVIMLLTSNSIGQSNCTNITFTNVIAGCHGVVPGTTNPAYAFIPQFTNNSGQGITSFTVTTTQAIILSASTQGPFGTGSISGAAIIFSNPTPMPVFFNFTFTLANNTQCVVRVAVDYPTCPSPSSCNCTSWPAAISYNIGNTPNTSTATGAVANSGVIVLNPNLFLSFINVVPPCNGSNTCQRSISYELFGPTNNTIPVGNNMNMLSTIFRNLPCSNNGTYKLVIKAKCGNTNCPVPFTIFISKPCYSPAMSICGTAICSANDTNTNLVNISVNGGTPPFTYLWSNGSTSQNLTGVMPGTYTVTVTDAFGFKTTASFMHTCLPLCNFPQRPNILNTINTGQSLTIGFPAESGITYSWFSNPVGFTSTVSNPTVTPTISTTYTLIRRNGNPSCPPKISTVAITVN